MIRKDRDLLKSINTLSRNTPRLALAAVENRSHLCSPIKQPQLVRREALLERFEHQEQIGCFCKCCESVEMVVLI
jgi:hypothetical protein